MEGIDIQSIVRQAVEEFVSEKRRQQRVEDERESSPRMRTRDRVTELERRVRALEGGR